MQTSDGTARRRRDEAAMDTNGGGGGAASPAATTYTPGPRSILKRRIESKGAHAAGIRWDEENIMTTEADRGNKMKILEPKTPFIHYNLSTDEIVGSTGVVPPFELNSAIQRARDDYRSDGMLSSSGLSVTSVSSNGNDSESLSSEFENRVNVSKSSSSIKFDGVDTINGAEASSGVFGDVISGFVAAPSPREWQSENDEDDSVLARRSHGASMGSKSFQKGSGGASGNNGDDPHHSDQFRSSTDADDDDDDDNQDRSKRQKFSQMRSQHYNMKNVLQRAHDLLSHSNDEDDDDDDNGDSKAGDDGDDEDDDDQDDDEDDEDDDESTNGDLGANHRSLISSLSEKDASATLVTSLLDTTGASKLRKQEPCESTDDTMDVT